MNILEYDARLDEVESSSQALVRDYLVSNGWKYTSNHPGSIWLWTFTKTTLSAADDDAPVEVHRLKYAVNESTALQFQRYWELEKQHFPAHGDDCAIFETFDWNNCNCMTEDDLAALDG